MKALCVDDEPILLTALKKAVEASPDISSAETFTSGRAALEYASENHVDIAFLDIQIHKMNGIELAENLRKMMPKLPIVFCTGYNDYALDAFRIHANGYLTKPITAPAVQEQIDSIKELMGIVETKKLTVRCFGNFEVFFDDKPVIFKRAKAKEMLAYLIDRKGASVTSGQIGVELWNDDADEKGIKNNIYQALHSLKAALNEIGMDDVLIKSSAGYAVNTTLLDCDYYKFLESGVNAAEHPVNEYMYQYSWAENTLAELLNE